MNWSDFLNQALAVTSNFNLKIAIILYLLCAVGEIGFGIPYILETIWLLAGYNLAHQTLSLSNLLLIWCVAQAGRQSGSIALFYSGVLGMAPLKKLYKRFIEPKMPKRRFIPPAISKHLTNPSPFSIAIGRLLGLRIPMALAMSARNKLSHLALGVVLSSIIWDGIYIIIGITVGNVLKTEYVVLYSVGGLTVLYISVLVIRYQIEKHSSKNNILNPKTEKVESSKPSP
jgi:membrane protein DedA with SNARE-associated domain